MLRSVYQTTPENQVIVAFLLSSAAIFFDHPLKLAIVLLESMVFVAVSGLNPLNGIQKFRQLIYLFLTMALLQNVFSPKGPALFSICGHGILFRDSLMVSVSIVFRVLVLAVTGYLFVSMGEKRFIDAMSAIGIPHLILFMTVIGLRFIPIIRNEVRDMLNSVRLRGLEPNAMGIKERSKFFLNLSIPLVFTTLNHATRIAAVLEARGFGSISRKRKAFKTTTAGVIIFLLTAVSILTLALVHL